MGRIQLVEELQRRMDGRMPRDARPLGELDPPETIETIITVLYVEYSHRYVIGAD